VIKKINFFLTTRKIFHFYFFVFLTVSGNAKRQKSKSFDGNISQNIGEPRAISAKRGADFLKYLKRLFYFIFFLEESFTVFFPLHPRPYLDGKRKYRRSQWFRTTRSHRKRTRSFVLFYLYFMQLGY
jgi:hypothetical protein